MDIKRDPKPKQRKRIIIGAAVVVGLVVVTGALRSLPSAVPTVDYATVWPDTVVRGTLVRQVRGPGTLVPEQARLITAVTNGRIEEIRLLPGVEVKAGDLILRMSNPDVDMQLLQAQTQMADARSQLTQLNANLQTNRLQQQGAVAQLQTQLSAARRDYETNRRLFETNPDLVARSELERTQDQVAEMDTRVDLEKQRLEVMDSSREEQIQAQKDQVARLQEQVAFNQDRLRSLEVRAPGNGVLSPTETPLQEGMYVLSGQQLARIVVPGRLKAEIRIPQTQAQEILVGQQAFIDTRSDTIVGRVVRIDPAVRAGTISIDVALPTELPPSVRPDLSVDGNVVIEQLNDVTYMGRPTYGQANAQVTVFKITPDGEYADRVQVRLGAASVNEIEVKEGLSPGDIVIISDMSQWDSFDRVKLRRR
ncbi:MAG: HlyD family efflux transporter periplasmic adaptor subunit [Gemmatimonadetes bacterium]|nr:HlyD family efflux transporter periplasmic adaptor subunit [Gemmatimonadota bacterium]